ncbi:MAG: hypothetical protein ABFS02_09095 [Pseudomonadota bacterium]
MRTILLLLITCNAYAGEDMALKRQAALNFLNAIGNFDEIHDQFINLIKDQFDLYLRNHPDMTEENIEPYKQSVHISKGEFLDFQVDNLFQVFTISEIRNLTRFFNTSLGKKWIVNENNLGLKNMNKASEIYKQVRAKKESDFEKQKRQK